MEASVADAHVPQGTSRWEIGAGQDPRRKAQSDYRKRTANPLGANPATTTFVFLTPRSWPGRAETHGARPARERVRGPTSVPRRGDENPEDGVCPVRGAGSDGQQLVSSGLWLRSWARAVVNSARACVASGRNTAARWQFWKASRMP